MYRGLKGTAVLFEIFSIISAIVCVLAFLIANYSSGARVGFIIAIIALASALSFWVIGDLFKFFANVGEDIHEIKEKLESSLHLLIPKQ